MSEVNQLNENEIVDKKGRIIRLKEITGKTRIAFYRALGGKDATNLAIVGEYWPVMAVQSIEERECPIKILADVEKIYDMLEEGDAFGLIDEWMQKRLAQDEENKKEDKSLKK